MLKNTDLIMYDEEYQKFKKILDNFLVASSSKYVFLLSTSGQILVESGETEDIDVTSLASLVAGSVSATGGLADLIGESNFSVLFHEGTETNVYISIVTEKMILVIIFPKKTPLGLVRLKMRSITPSLQKTYQELLKRMDESDNSKLLENISDDDLDNLFDF